MFINSTPTANPAVSLDVVLLWSLDNALDPLVFDDFTIRPLTKTGSEIGGPRVRNCKTGILSYVQALLRYTPVGGWLRHPDGTGAARASGHQDHDDPSASSGQVYTHVLNRGGRGVRSPLDRLQK
jgi:hypothetical protein